MKVLAEHHVSPKSRGSAPSGVSLIDRAMAAYRSAAYKSSGDSRYDIVHPGLVQHVELDGKEYVVLWRAGVRDCILRVYRVRAYDGILRVMKRPPRELHEVQAA